MLASYHVHSSWSDGKGSIPELVDAARAGGLQEIGISDHLALHPSGRPPRWSMPPGRLGEYVAEVRFYMGRKDLSVRLGLEADWFESRREALREVLQEFHFEYVLGSVHYIDPALPSIDSDPAFWGRMPQAKLDEGTERYWRMVRSMADSGLFQVAAHLDLPKKFWRRTGRAPARFIAEALDAVARSRMAVELNTSGRHKPCGEMYPSMSILKACRARDIPVMLSSDAHDPIHLLRDFGLGCAALRDAGYSQVLRLGKKGFVPMPLARVEARLSAPKGSGHPRP